MAESIIFWEVKANYQRANGVTESSYMLIKASTLQRAVTMAVNCCKFDGGSYIQVSSVNRSSIDRVI